MLDALIKVAEKIAELARYRQQLRERRLDKVFEPLYTSMMEVHRDYLKMLESVHQDIAHGKDPVELAKELGMARLQQEPLRISLRNKISSFSEARLENAAGEFLRSVSRYFSLTQIDAPISAGSQVLRAVMDWIQEDRRGALRLDDALREEARRDVQMVVRDTLRRLRAEWEEVSRAHAHLVRESL
jgi:hypothetical protein